MSTGFAVPPNGRWSRIEMAPNATLVYDLDWNNSDDPWLETGDSIATVASCTITPASAGLTTSDVAHTSSKTQVRLHSSNSLEVYRVTFAITTANGNADSRSFEVSVAIR